MRALNVGTKSSIESLAAGGTENKETHALNLMSSSCEML